MKFITFQKRRGSNRGGLLIGGSRVLDLGLAYSKNFNANARPDDTAGMIDALRGLSSSIVDILNSGDDLMRSCFQLEKMAREGNLEDCLYSMGDCTLVAPIPNPPLLIHFNVFESQARRELRWLRGDSDADLPDHWHTEPAYYLANPGSVLGPGDKVVFPEGEEMIDYELQVGAVLGETISNVGFDEAEDAILGYTLVNAWVARGMQRRACALAMGPSSARGFATSIGPYIVTKDEIPRVQELDLGSHVNGEGTSSSTFADAAFTFPQMISHASQGCTLPAGTIIASGCAPEGSALATQRWLKAGDKVELQADIIGTLTNEVHSRRHPRVFSGQG